jgi:hypothetical protein
MVVQDCVQPSQAKEFFMLAVVGAVLTQLQLRLEMEALAAVAMEPITMVLQFQESQIRAVEVAEQCLLGQVGQVRVLAVLAVLVLLSFATHKLTPHLR